MPEGFCPPCKVIIDCGGRLFGALRRLARAAGVGSAIEDAALYYADIVDGGHRALVHAFDTGFIKPGSDEADRAHAWAELSCHRAKMFEARARQMRGHNDDGGMDFGALGPDGDLAETLDTWATQHREFVTALVGGEYRGAYEILPDLSGIQKKVE